MDIFSCTLYQSRDQVDGNNYTCTGELPARAAGETYDMTASTWQAAAAAAAAAAGTLVTSCSGARPDCWQRRLSTDHAGYDVRGRQVAT